MVKELELFSLDGATGWFRRTKGHPFVPAPGQKCLNCDTEILGQYCYHCGQDASHHQHRTIGHLIFEAFEGLFHLDGRVWQTLPPLFFAPGKLAHDLMEGRVARHVPPFRIFLVALLVFMFVAEHRTDEARLHPHPSGQMPLVTADFDDDKPAPVTAGTTHQAQIVGMHTGDLSKLHETTATDPKTGNKTITRTIDIFSMSEEDAHYLSGLVAQSHIQPPWLKDDLVKALGDKDRFFAAVFTWGHRLALLLLPIFGIFLSFLYMGKKYKNVFLYDHLMISMNLLSFMFFTNALRMLLPGTLDAVWVGLLTLWTLVYFFQTLRGAYGSSILGAVVKSLLLWMMSGITFGLLLAGVMFIALTVA